MGHKFVCSFHHFNPFDLLLFSFIYSTCCYILLVINKLIKLFLGVPDVHLEKQDIKEDGSMWFTMTIKSVPVPHLVQWNVKEEHSKTFQQINVNAAEYKGTSDSFPHPVLVLNHIKKIENYIFEIEVQNRIGEVKREIPGNNDIFQK